VIRSEFVEAIETHVHKATTGPDEYL